MPTRLEHCLTCGRDISRGFTHNPAPITSVLVGKAVGAVGTDREPADELRDRRVCSDCNAMHVTPARLGHEVRGELYDRDGREIGTFWNQF